MDLITQSTAYTTPLHSTAQCIQEGTHRCCCCRCKSHHSDRGRLYWRGRSSQQVNNTGAISNCYSNVLEAVENHLDGYSMCLCVCARMCV